MTLSKFIVIDGLDGSGKGTQVNLLKEWLKERSVLFTREPGGTPRAEEIRDLILKTNGHASTPLCDMLLFYASRALHIEQKIGPQLISGTSVISDRYDSSTVAFQIYGEEKSNLLPMFCAIRNALPPVYIPDAYIFLDLPAEVAFERRAKDMAQEKSKFDLKPIEYHERVRKGFEFFANEFAPKNSYFIDANQAPEHISEKMKSVVKRILEID